LSYAEDNEAKSLGEMVTKGNFGLDFRYRYEHVDQDSFDEDANANTLRSRLTLSSATYQGLSPERTDL
jgi:hypothetical protein